MRYRKRFIVATVLLAMLAGTAGFAAATPPDVVDLPSQAAVEYLMGLGVVAGYPDGTIKPAGTITRAEAVKVIIVVTYGDEELAQSLAGQSPFDDVPSAHWASGHIALAKADGIVEGHGDGSFGPDDPVTYAQYAKMLVEAAGLAGDADLTWPDNYVTVATAAGMVADISGFAANAPAPRGYCFMMTAFTVQSVIDPATGLTLGQSVFGEATVMITNVTQGIEHATLAEAIEAAAAGDVLEIPAGTVIGNVTIPENLRDLAITGAGAGETTITGDVTVEVTADGEQHLGAVGFAIEAVSITGTLTVFQGAVVADVEVGGDLVADLAGGSTIGSVSVAGDMYLQGSEMNLEHVNVAGDVYVAGPHIEIDHLTVGGTVFGAAIHQVRMSRTADQLLVRNMHDEAQDLYLAFKVGGDYGEYTGAMESGRTITLEVFGVDVDDAAAWDLSAPEVLAVSVDKLDDWGFVVTFTVKDSQTLAAGTEVVLAAPDGAVRTGEDSGIQAWRDATAPWWMYQYRLSIPVEMLHTD